MKQRVENGIINVFFSFSYTLVTFLIFLNPSGAPPDNPFKKILYVFLLSIMLSSIFYFTLHYLSLIKNIKIFLINLFIHCFITIITIIYLGLNIHRDYFSLIFIILTIYYIVFLSKLDIFRQNKNFYRAVYFFSIILIVVIFFWILLMGYSIVKREEPRWIESILYNVYYISIIIILYFKNFKISYLLKRKIQLIERKIFIDNFDLSQIIGEDYIKILRVLFYKKRANCYEINDSLKRNQTNHYIECSEDCDKKAHLCNSYRNIYNKINYCKKILELLKIGTIKNPPNKRNIKNEGWQLILEKECMLEFQEE